MDSSGSVTKLIQQLRAEEDTVRNEAAQLIWQRFFPRLLKLAESKIDKGLRAREDGEDVLQSMYKSFCLRQQRGDFNLANRDELWQILVTITQRKVRNVANKHRRLRRDYRRDQATPHTPNPEAGSWQWSFEQMDGAEPTPSEAAVLNEEIERRLGSLPENLRQIAVWKLEGYTNEEIAGPDKLDCALRTVERKLARIRKAWGD